MDEGEQPPTSYPPAPSAEDAPNSPSHNNDLPRSATAGAAPDTTDQPATPANDNAPAPSGSAPGDTPVPPVVDRIQIILKDQANGQVAFAIKSSTKMEKVMNVYADKTGRRPDTLRYYFEGDRIVAEDTVASLGMVNEDIVEVMTEQIGGGLAEITVRHVADKSIADHEPFGSGRSLCIKVASIGRAGRDLPTVVYPAYSSDSMDTIYAAYNLDAGTHPGTIRFFFEGQRALSIDTPESLGVCDGDTINAYIETMGGGKPLIDKYVAKHFPDKECDEFPIMVYAPNVGNKQAGKMEFVIGPKVKVQDLMKTWSERAQCCLDSVVFRQNADKEGPGLPFYAEDETFGDLDFDCSDEIWVTPTSEEPINLVRPKECTKLPERINIKVGSCEIAGRKFDAVHFLMRPRTTLGNLMKAWAKETGFQGAVAFYQEHPHSTGNTETRISKTDTPGALGFEDGVTLLVVKDDIDIESSECSSEDCDAESDEESEIESATFSPEPSAKSLTVIVRYVGVDDVSREMRCKMNKDTRFEKFITQYSERWGVDAHTQHLTLNGKTVFPSDTPASIGVEDGAELAISEALSVFPMDITLN